MRQFEKDQLHADARKHFATGLSSSAALLAVIIGIVGFAAYGMIRAIFG